MNAQRDSSERKKLLKAAKDLLNYCSSNKPVSLDYDLPVINGFIKYVSNLKELSEIWSFDEGFDILFLLLEDFINQEKVKVPPIADNVVEEFVNNYIVTLSRNTKDYWLVMPLEDADLSNPISFGDYFFIPEDIDREEKIKVLADLVSISYKEMEKRVEHTEKTRSENFYDYPLMCHKINRFNSWIRIHGSDILCLDIAILRVIEHSTGKKDRGHAKPISKLIRKSNKHFLIHSQGLSNWGHQLLSMSEQSAYFSGDLNWLEITKYQNEFTGLNSILGDMNPIDRLTFRFRKAFLLFNKSIDIQLMNRGISGGFALELLHLMIAAECILLNRENEKRLRLATLLSRLVKIEEKSTKEIFDAVNDIYNWRSDYVHSGEDVFPEYDRNFKEGDIQKKIKLVRQAISCLLLNTPKWIGNSNVGNLCQDKSNEKVWFDYLDNIWFSVLSGQDEKSA